MEPLVIPFCLGWGDAGTQQTQPHADSESLFLFSPTSLLRDKETRQKVGNMAMFVAISRVWVKYLSGLHDHK